MSGVSEEILELRHFRFFIAVAETGSFTRAAERLSVTQPAISRQIAQLERIVGSKLLDRNGHRVQKTEAGRLFEAEAREVLHRCEESVRLVSDVEGVRRGTVSVGLVPVCNLAFAAAFSKEFHTAHPGVHLVMEEQSALDIETQLERGQLDLGVGFLSHSAPTIVYEKLLSSNFQLIVDSKHPLAKHKSVDLKMITDLRLVMLPTRYHMRNLIDLLFRKYRLRPNIVLDNNALSTILHILESSHVATLLPEFVPIRQLSPNLRGIRISDKQKPLNVGLMWARGRSLSGPARAFAELARLQSRNWL